MSLDLSQLSSLMSVLAEENTSSQPLEAIGNTFHQFFSKPDFFKIGCALVTILQNKDQMIHPTQRIVCIYFLYDMYRTDAIVLNPFVSVLTNLVSPSSISHNGAIKEYHWSTPRLSPQEKYFVSQLLTSPSKELFKKTATQILQADPSGLGNIDISAIQVSIAEKLSDMPQMSKIGLSCLISDTEAMRFSYEEVVPKNGSDLQKQCLENLLVGSEAPFRKSIRPEFIRLAPPLHVDQDELIWLDPIDYTPDLAWDTTVLNSSSSSSNMSEIRKLMAKACRSQLNITQQQELDNALGKDCNLILHLDITPSKFASLVEFNPLVAVKMILAYQELDSYDLSPYLEELLKMKMSVHSMEVVNNLAMSVILPDEFIHLYISTCISKCESMTEDKPLQTRLVRLLCAFIQSLIRNRIIDAKELHIELQPFCIEFSAIREAGSLFRLLKSMSNSETTNTTTNAASGSQQANSNKSQQKTK